MKSILPLTLLLSLTFISKAQNFIITFDDTAVTNLYFYTDSTLDSLGIWQIGVPNKPIFDSAYSPPNSIVTLLDSSMPINSTASFIISIPYQFNYFPGAMMTFANKIDFDTAHGGAYVEFSIDSGVHWHSVLMPYVYGGYYVENGQQAFCFSSCTQILVDSQYIFAPMWWHNVPQKTTLSGVNYYTGTDSTWLFDTIIIPIGCVFKTEPLKPLMLRFTAFEDSSSESKAGWMIDNFTFQSNPYICIGGINEINSSHIKVYPDPVIEGFTISLIDAGVHEYSVAILDLMGRQVLYRDENIPEVTLSRAGIAAGSYVIKVTDKQTGTTMVKRVVFE